MRDMKNVDAQGIGNSKEFGFVSFTTHEDALQALRSINNNPNIFTPARVRVIASISEFLKPSIWVTSRMRYYDLKPSVWVACKIEVKALYCTCRLKYLLNYSDTTYCSVYRDQLWHFL